MSTLNVDIPRFYCHMRKEFLYDGTKHIGEFVNVCAFAVASVSGRALGFHILTDEGAMIWRVPIHALCHMKTAPRIALDWLQFWDCFGYEIACNAFDRLKECRCRVHMKDGSWIGGQYMFTLDWYGSEDSEDAGEGGHKCAHVIALDNGNFAAQSNNRIQWFDPSFITPFKEKPDYLTNTRVWSVERETETSNGYYFDASPEKRAQVQLYCKGAAKLMDDDKFQLILVVLCFANGISFGFWKHSAQAAIFMMISTFLFCALLIGVAEIAEGVKK